MSNTRPINRSTQPQPITNHRGRVYSCLRCKSPNPFQGERCKLILHVFRKHTALDQVPFYCNICRFITTTQKDLEKHTDPRHYPTHAATVTAMKSQQQDINENDSLLQNIIHYTPQEDIDYKVLSKEDSDYIFSQRRRQPSTSTSSTAISNNENNNDENNNDNENIINIHPSNNTDISDRVIKIRDDTATTSLLKDILLQNDITPQTEDAADVLELEDKTMYYSPLTYSRPPTPQLRRPPTPQLRRNPLTQLQHKPTSTNKQQKKNNKTHPRKTTPPAPASSSSSSSSSDSSSSSSSSSSAGKKPKIDHSTQTPTCHMCTDISKELSSLKDTVKTMAAAMDTMIAEVKELQKQPDTRHRDTQPERHTYTRPSYQPYYKHEDRRQDYRRY